MRRARVLESTGSSQAMAETNECPKEGSSLTNDKLDAGPEWPLDEKQTGVWPSPGRETLGRHERGNEDYTGARGHLSGVSREL